MSNQKNPRVSKSSSERKKKKKGRNKSRDLLKSYFFILKAIFSRFLYQLLARLAIELQFNIRSKNVLPMGARG